MRKPADVLRLMALTGAFAGGSWGAWRVVLRALFALPFASGDLETFQRLTGRTEAPTAPARELWAVCGRRAGKSIVAALVAVFLSTCRVYKLAPGERGTFMLIAADRRQARTMRRYIGGLLGSTPALAQLVAHETQEAIELTSGIVIEVHTASFRTVRGYTVIGCVADELAFWPVEDAAEPDSEVLAALRPAMATVEGAMLLCLSSPYARKGELFKAHRDHYGKDGDPVLVVSADTRTLNPRVPPAVIERAFEDDPVAAMSEYGRDGKIEFRSDVESFVSREAVEGCVIPGRLELPPVASAQYVGFLDFAGGSGGDSAALAIAHAEPRGELTVAVLDLAREVKPPFSPEQVCADFARDLLRYGVTRARADRWAGNFPVEAMRKRGITVEPSERVKSDIYREALPLLNSGTVELLDLPRLHAQLVGLERRVARGGKDSIDHGVGGHDDVVNAAAGALVAAAVRHFASATWGRSKPAATADVLAVQARPGGGSEPITLSVAPLIPSGARLQRR